jgi:tRNA (mo5U34)-methyltransferase
MSPLNFESFFNNPQFSEFAEHIEYVLNERLVKKQHGHLATWLEIVDSLPEVSPSKVDLNQGALLIGLAEDISPEDTEKLLSLLQAMKPWRKGPFNFFGIHVDTEWRSDWKWQRIAPHISSLEGKRVLDVGCGSGYHGWRMLGAGADYVLGIDPTLRFKIQHMICQKYIQATKKVKEGVTEDAKEKVQFDFLPLGIEDLPENMSCFDTTFSMGILYHRRDPEQHILELKNTLKSGGQLVLETLVMDEEYHGVKNGVFVPTDRYAQMRNVWNIPTISHLEKSCEKLGFTDIKCIESNVTSLDEQRRTDWIDGYSLREFLDPEDTSKTIEGYPAPKRATVVATND